MAPQTLLIDRGESRSGGLHLAWPRIRNVIAHQWDLSPAALAWLCMCPPEALTVSRVGPVLLAHGGEWARARELECLHWPLLDPVRISGKAVAIRPDHQTGGWRALTKAEADNAERVLFRYGGQITPSACCRWAQLRNQLGGRQLEQLNRARSAEREQLLLRFARQRAAGRLLGA